MANEETLNGPQKRHLLSSCQYADKLLSEVEGILHASESKTIFPKYNGALSPIQVRIVGDYIARIRSQILTSLRSQSISVPKPEFNTTHSARVTLMFAGIAFEECTADKMRGYGEVPPGIVPVLDGLVTEIKALLDQLTGFLAEGVDQEPSVRLERLGQTGDEVELLKKLGRAITEHGLVDYRNRLTAILDRLEVPNFEIALFGRVSSGKSSLLNHLVHANILPVGVNPVTSIPTRIIFGMSPKILVTVAGQAPQEFGIDRITEFVTEEYNPANKRRVERLLVEYPAASLKDGIVWIDTPGLGSLATAGAAETLAYLPRCDLGVLLIDAGSTLAAEDLSTLQALNDAGIQTVILLSKADLLSPDDLLKTRQYVTRQIHSNVRMEAMVRAISIRAGFEELTDRWFSEEVAPLYERHKELTARSLRRKIGALRDAVIGTLAARLARAEHKAESDEIPSWAFAAETKLRHASGQFERLRERCYEQTLEIREYGKAFLHEAAESIVDAWRNCGSTAPATGESLSTLAAIVAAEKANTISALMEELTQELSEVIGEVAALLGEESAPAVEELSSVVKEMPRIDLGTLDLRLTRPWTTKISHHLAVRTIEKRLHAAVGTRIQESFTTYGSLLDAWSRRTASELQLRFNSHADAYRARLARNSETSRAPDAFTISSTLQELGSSAVKARDSSIVGTRE